MHELRIVEATGSSVQGAKQNARAEATDDWQIVAESLVTDGPPTRVRTLFQSKLLQFEPDDAPFRQLVGLCAAWALKHGPREWWEAAPDLRPYFPGSPTFVCAEAQCTNSCCKKDDVIVTSRFAHAVKSAYNLEERAYTGESVGTPAKRLHVVKKKEGSVCFFLDPNHRCTVYPVRPAECVSYPFLLALFDLLEDGRIQFVPYATIFAKGPAPLAFFRKGAHGHNFLVPLVMYHADCPGLTGSPVSWAAYRQLAKNLCAPAHEMQTEWSGAGEPLFGHNIYGV